MEYEQIEPCKFTRALCFTVGCGCRCYMPELWAALRKMEHAQFEPCKFVFELCFTVGCGCGRCTAELWAAHQRMECAQTKESFGAGAAALGNVTLPAGIAGMCCFEAYRPACRCAPK
eukprot:scaffold179548_cov21-Tisochrysis_lutea.AAC.1